VSAPQFRSRVFVPLVLVAVAAFALAAGGSLAAGAPPWRVIVNPSNPTSAVERRFLADAFLKKVTRWSTGDTIRPVDQRDESAVRQRFSDDVLGRSVAAVKSYWAQLVFSGRELPPPELESDEEIVRFVLKNVGAVGYVSPAANVDHVKLVTVR
jgi:ABC-type phosphate transport system substrate-binding protein